jgi:hypothetical protein
MSSAELRHGLSEAFGPTVASDEQLLSECKLFDALSMLPA